MPDAAVKSNDVSGLAPAQWAAKHFALIGIPLPVEYMAMVIAPFSYRRLRDAVFGGAPIRALHRPAGIERPVLWIAGGGLDYTLITVSPATDPCNGFPYDPDEQLKLNSLWQ